MGLMLSSESRRKQSILKVSPPVRTFPLPISSESLTSCSSATLVKKKKKANKPPPKPQTPESDNTRGFLVFLEVLVGFVPRVLRPCTQPLVAVKGSGSGPSAAIRGYPIELWASVPVPPAEAGRSPGWNLPSRGQHDCSLPCQERRELPGTAQGSRRGAPAPNAAAATEPQSLLLGPPAPVVTRDGAAARPRNYRGQFVRLGEPQNN